ncbi:MAG TPA: alpha/beta hydrolase [Burkholderiales bacterium]|nr:alpha/beta hydrolase [Burkholderiales bacterium]
MIIERGLVKTGLGYMHYRTAGKAGGEAIFLQHINQQSSALYLELMAVLSPGLHVVAMDYPSHGNSDHVDAQPTIGDYARCVVEVADALNIQKFSVLGEAVGAAVSIELAANHAQRVNQAVLVNCPYYKDHSVAQARHAPLKSGLRPEDASGFPLTRTIEFLLANDPGHAPVQPTQSWMDRVNVAQIEAGRHRWQALDALHRYDLAANLQRIQCPVLLLMGEHFYYVQYRDEFHNKNKHLGSEVLARARFCMGWERAADVGRHTLEFLRAS